MQKYTTYVGASIMMVRLTFVGQRYGLTVHTDTICDKNAFKLALMGKQGQCNAYRIYSLLLLGKYKKCL